MTYEEFKAGFEASFKNFLNYNEKQAGYMFYLEEMGKWSDDYPEFMEKYDNSPDAYIVK